MDIRRKRIPASECPPGWYRSRPNDLQPQGSKIEIIPVIKVRWHLWTRRPFPEYVPYQRMAVPGHSDYLYRVTLRSWLPPDYLLLPCSPIRRKSRKRKKTTFRSKKKTVSPAPDYMNPDFSW